MQLALNSGLCGIKGMAALCLSLLEITLSPQSRRPHICADPTALKSMIRTFTIEKPREYKEEKGSEVCEEEPLGSLV